MEDIIVGAVESLVKGFLQYLDEKKRLIEEAHKQVEELRQDLTFLTNHLKESVKKPISNNLITTSLLREVRNSIYKAEDAVDSFVADKESRVPTFSKSDIAELIISVAGKVKEVRIQVEQHINNSSGHSAADDEVLGEYKGSPAIQEYAPIFKEEEKTLRQRLTREAEKADVADMIFITGTHGIGKTTLAAKMFHDSEIRQHFTMHIWVTVPNPTPKRIFCVVLRQLKKLPDSNNEWELSQQVASCLENERFLLVLDNVPEIDEWANLKSAFHKKGKVLITSNNDALARSIVLHESPIKLNPLNLEDSWTLLRLRAPSCPLELVETGKLIAANCEGLPHKIVVAGVALARDDAQPDEMKQRKEIWRRVSLGIITFFKDEPNEQHNTSILSSYNELPYNLRACFLYLGIFPKHSKFSVSKLIRMWIAEGFVQPTKCTVTLEETAQEYLRHLASRNLVTIEEEGPNCSVKTCSMNELLYDFCKKEAGLEEENFLQEFKSISGTFFPPIEKARENRRVCVHDHISKFITGFISSSRQDRFEIRLRSFVSHSKEVFDLHKGDVSKICAAFKLLRVLDAKPIKVDKIRSGLCMLVHLRYITLSLSGDVIPEAISKLRNIQTLIVDTESRTLEIKADILTMVELRHFKTNASATLPKRTNASEENEHLQTLCGVSPESCTRDFLRKLSSLKKLGICGQLAQLLLDGTDELLSELVKVEKLKLQNHETEGKKLKLQNWRTSPKHESKLSSLLLHPSRFPPSLQSLTLSSTCLDWKHISILGSLDKLKVLKLKDNAFVGEKWQVTDDGFSHLETLHIVRADFLQWQASSNQFPQLRRLLLSDCTELMEIPIALADIPTFQELDLRNCGDAVDSAKSIEEIKIEKWRANKNIVFKLLPKDFSE